MGYNVFFRVVFFRVFTVKILKFGTPQTIAIIVLKTIKFDVTLHPKDADGMANSVDPDQTASEEAV